MANGTGAYHAFLRKQEKDAYPRQLLERALNSADGINNTSPRIANSAEEYVKAITDPNTRSGLNVNQKKIAEDLIKYHEKNPDGLKALEAAAKQIDKERKILIEKITKTKEDCDKRIGRLQKLPQQTQEVIDEISKLNDISKDLGNALPAAAAAVPAAAAAPAAQPSPKNLALSSYQKALEKAETELKKMDNGLSPHLRFFNKIKPVDTTELDALIQDLETLVDLVDPKLKQMTFEQASQQFTKEIQKLEKQVAANPKDPALKTQLEEVRTAQATFEATRTLQLLKQNTEALNKATDGVNQIADTMVTKELADDKQKKEELAKAVAEMNACHAAIAEQFKGYQGMRMRQALDRLPNGPHEFTKQLSQTGEAFRTKDSERIPVAVNKGSQINYSVKGMTHLHYDPETRKFSRVPLADRNGNPISLTLEEAKKAVAEWNAEEKLRCQAAGKSFKPITLVEKGNGRYTIKCGDQERKMGGKEFQGGRSYNDSFVAKAAEIQNKRFAAVDPKQSAAMSASSPSSPITLASANGATTNATGLVQQKVPTSTAVVPTK